MGCWWLEQRKEIYRRFTRGVPVDRLASRFCRTKASVYRIVSEVRAQRLLEQPMDYIDSEEFTAAKADKLILAAPPERDKQSPRVKAPPGLPPYLARLYSIPLLTREDEVYYFRKMNYLKRVKG